MLNERQRLSTCRELQSLLSSYASTTQSGSPAWQARLMRLDGLDEHGLVKLHGELLAYGWIEQNIGGPGCCYRITSSGVQALRLAAAPTEDEEDSTAEAA